jgi:hypothetical protein
MVARWYIFEPKIPIWVNFAGSCNGKCWYIFYYFTAIWYILLSFGIFFPILVYCTKKSSNPAPVGPEFGKSTQFSSQLITSLGHLCPEGQKVMLYKARPSFPHFRATVVISAQCRTNLT